MLQYYKMSLICFKMLSQKNKTLKSIKTKCNNEHQHTSGRLGKNLTGELEAFDLCGGKLKYKTLYY